MILDDFFNPFWPGVAEGACAFMRSDNTDLVPVAITSNKFFFAKGADPAAAYREGLRQAYPDAKTSRVFGHDVLSFEAPTSSERMRKKIRQTVATSTPWKLIRHTAAGAALRNGFRRWM